MATRVSGTRTTVRNGSSTISAPLSTVIVATTLTNITGDIIILGKLVVSNTGSTSTVIINNDNTANVDNPLGFEYDPNNIYGNSGQRLAGALYVPGGVGIEKDLNVGGYIYGRVSQANTSLELLVTSTNVDATYYPILAPNANGPAPIYSDNTGVKGGLTYNPARGKLTLDRLHVASTDSSTSTITGAFTVSGGVGILGDVNIGMNVTVGEDIKPFEDRTQRIGNTATQWLEGYLENIYTRTIRSTSGDIKINPAAGLTEVMGDLRVLGNRPIGTAPVVTNILYVTVDGDDTNDGRAMDPSRACRTVTGAVNSPYFQPGTQIRVAPGFYLEDNPIRLKPYTSVMGSDIRTTFIEPINKTQDLFHVDSGCYIAFCTFLNGRSGLLEGPYLSEYNRGAYATAFPPLEGNERIDLFHSPYIQNCTNQSGPWLKDGTMYVPNQTVQVPLAVATGSWPANTASIIVEVSTGTIQQGMYINAGPQNPGFFNARTLMLANKSFMQEQVVKYVDNTFSTGTFVYDQVKCARDTGLIVESIALDLLQNSTSESVFAGLQYWSQSGYVDAIGDQITTTTAAITYLKTQVATIATSAGGPTPASIVNYRFDDILSILSSGTVGVTDIIVNNSTATTTGTFVAAYNAIIAAKSSLQNSTINYINSTLTAFSYDQTKCSRDTGLIVDSLVLDLLFPGNSQSTFAGLQYWDQGGYVGGIASEITTTTNAINYVKSLAQKIVVNDVTGTRYQSTLTQYTAFPPALAAQATIVGNDFQVILDILGSGTAGVSDLIVPNGITASTVTNVVNAYRLLQANKSYIEAEAIAYVESTKTAGFVYDQTKCKRDVGYMVDSVSFDLLYSGNKQAVQSGVYYYSFNGSSTAVPNEIPQVVAAYNYIKELVPNIIQNIPITSTYQTATTQVFGTPGTYIESTKAQQNLDLITNIIQNGPSVAPEPTPISLNKTTELDILSGAALLNANRSFIRAEVIAYVNTLKTFLFDEQKCRRDVGYMVDSVAFDLLHGGNKQSIKAGVYYYGYDATSTEIPNEIPQTTAAYNFIKQLIPDIVKADTIVNTYQTATTQVTNLTPASDYEVEALRSKIDLITSIIRNGPNSAPPRVPINLSTSQVDGVTHAYNLLLANKEFIKAEVIAFLNEEMGTFDYSREKCYRDVGILIENVSYDASFGGNEKTVQSGLAYYDGVISRIAGQETQTISAIDYLNQLCQKVITNTTCTDLFSYGTGTTATSVQSINYVLTDGEVAGRSISDLFNTITTIIGNGPEAAPTIYKASNVDAAFVSAEVLMQANKKFIQEDTINYINNIIYSGALPYSEIKCRRDTGLIIDSIAFDMLHPTSGNSQSTFAGLQYWNQDEYVGDIVEQVGPTVDAVTYLKELTGKVIQNITPADDLIPRYQSTVTQVTSYEAATANEVSLLGAGYDIIIEIVSGNNTGWTDRIIPNSRIENNLPSIQNAYDILKANKNYLAHEVTAYVTSVHQGFDFDGVKCRRDVGYMVDAVAFDMLYGGNRQAIQNGLYYYGFSTSTSTIRNQEIQTTAAFNYLGTIAASVIQNVPVTPLQENASQNTTLSAADAGAASLLTSIVSTITNIISNGPNVAALPSAIAFTATVEQSKLNAVELLYANKEFLVEQVIAYIDQTYNANRFNYNEAKCYRDVGLIVDAVSHDILLGGNQKSIEAGVAYWNAGYNYVAGQETTTTMAINHAKDVALQVIANRRVTPQTGTVTQQIINPFFQYGGDYMPQEAVRRNFGIITTIIERGPLYAPPVYAGGGVFALTGLNGSDVKIAPQVTSVTTLSGSLHLIGISTATIGFGNNATLYFGDTTVFPYQNNEVEEISLEVSGSTSTWDLRKIDPIGSMGGSLVDGAVISDRSPIQSFVYDAYTQITQGGRGVRITNNGYAQLVSVFTVFCSVGVQVDNGGIASIVNSNANFGDICLVASGYGKRKFSGTIYNPPFKAYGRPAEFDQYYPNGFWPNAARVLVFNPDIDDRPHISLVMEVEPPVDYINEQALPGFLNASPSIATLATGTITITGIDTTGIAIGNFVYVRDQFGQFSTGTSNLRYSDTGTIVTDIGYQSVTLNKALTNGGGEIDNDNFFDIYFCGNAYYTVLSSEVATNPKPEGVNLLSTASTGGSISQIPIHIDSLRFLNSLTNQVINNAEIVPLQTATVQTIQPLVLGGGEAESFISLRFEEMIKIIEAPNVEAAESVIPKKLRTKTGTIPQGAGSAVSLIEANIDFLADEVVQYVQDNAPSTFTYDETLCRRDAAYITTGTYYDVALGTNYNSVTSGIAYRRSVSYEVTTTELTQTLAAINYLKQRTAQSMAGDPIAVSRSNAAYQEIMQILALGEEKADTIVFPSPVGVSTDLERAKNLLVANKDFIKAEIIAWISTQIAGSIAPFAGFTYNSAKCARDVGYIVDGLCYDILYGGNSAAVINARAYFEGAVSVIPGEATQTLAAYSRLSTIVQQIVQGIAVTVSSGNSIIQNASLPPASASEATTLNGLIQIIRNVISDGDLSSLNILTITYPSIGWTTGSMQLAVNEFYGDIGEIIDDMIAFINDEYSGTFTFNQDKCRRDVKITLQRLIYDLETGGRYNSVMVGLSYWSRAGTHHIVQLGENVRRTDLFPDGCTVNFYQRSYMSASGYVFEYVGAGTNYGALPQVGRADPVQGKETVQLNGGKVFFTSTDQNGDFRIGPGLVISQATGVLSGRTFTKSLFANMTPFILAIEGGS